MHQSDLDHTGAAAERKAPHYHLVLLGFTLVRVNRRMVTSMTISRSHEIGLRSVTHGTKASLAIERWQYYVVGKRSPMLRLEYTHIYIHIYVTSITDQQGNTPTVSDTLMQEYNVYLAKLRHRA